MGGWKSRWYNLQIIAEIEIKIDQQHVDKRVIENE